MAAPAPTQTAQSSGSISTVAPSAQAYMNAVSGQGGAQQITPSAQAYMNAVSGPQGGQSGTQVDTFTSPDVAVAGATQPFNALYNPIGGVVPYEQSPQYAKDAALLRQMQSSQVTVNGLQGDLLATLQEREKNITRK